MKTNLFLIAFTLFTTSLNAQIEIGLKTGLNSIDLITDGIVINTSNQDFKIDFKDSKYGHHFGLYTRVKALGMYIEPSLLFNSNSVEYKLTDYIDDDVIERVFKEKYQTLDIPVLFGVKAGVFRLFGGPVAHLNINSSSELFEFKEYSQKFKAANYGYQAGFGFDVCKLRLELAYEGNLSKFGDHITIGGNKYSFGTSASRLIGSVGYKF